MRAPSYRSYWPMCAKRWDAMTIKQMRPSCASPAAVNASAKKAVTNKARYETIEKLSGVPWWLVACLHEREAGGNFGCYLGNGQSLKRRTTQVPRGRGPFTGANAFERGALDALALDGFTRVKDWCLEKALYYAEKFNGFGYAGRGIPSPYIWAGSSIQVAAKYTSDGRLSLTTWDRQVGVAAMLKAMMALDASIKPARES